MYTAIVFNRLAYSLVPTALGLIVALLALWSYKYFRNEMECFDLEMHNATLDLMNRLAIQFRQHPVQ